MLKFTANLSLLFTEYPLLERFQAAKEQGFTAVEIQFPYTEAAEAIQQQLQATGLRLVLFNVDADDLLQGGEGLASVPEKRDQFRAAVAKTVAYAKILKPEVINVLPGRVPDESRRDQYLETFIENLQLSLEQFSPLGIKTAFEAVNTYDMPGFIIHTSRQMLDILEQLGNPNLFMQYDIYHMQMMNENPAQFISEQAEKIGHIQFADCPGRGRPGTGRINFSQVFSAIKNSAYSGWTGAEYLPDGPTIQSLHWFAV